MNRISIFMRRMIGVDEVLVGVGSSCTSTIRKESKVVETPGSGDSYEEIVTIDNRRITVLSIPSYTTATQTKPIFFRLLSPNESTLVLQPIRFFLKQGNDLEKCSDQATCGLIHPHLGYLKVLIRVYQANYSSDDLSTHIISDDSFLQLEGGPVMQYHSTYRMIRRNSILLLLLSPMFISLSSARHNDQHRHISPILIKLLTSRGKEGWIKRGCHVGLPCTYSHLSSIAAERTLQRMLVDYMHNCVSDPRCSPGRRKRNVMLSKRAVKSVPDRDMGLPLLS